MRKTKSNLCSREHLDLEIQRIVNRKLYEDNIILKNTYLRVEQEILKYIEKEKAKYNVTEN